MRKRPVITVGQDEDIAAVEHYRGHFVRVNIGRGDIMENGKFVFIQPQTFEVHEINGGNYEELMAANEETGKPEGQFRYEDLWPIIDKLRMENHLKSGV